MFANWKNRLHGVSGPVEYLIVELGNPGAKYEMTRHNAGFLFLDKLVEDCGTSVNRLKYHALCADTVVSGKRVLLMKPQTYMNASGEAVAQAARFYKIPPERILVVFDDISLDIGRIRIRRSGSHGGHNGIKSIIACVGSDKFPRVKIGVGKKPHPDYDLADWVLSNFRKEELEGLKDAVEHSIGATKLILDGQIDEAMNRYNS